MSKKKQTKKTETKEKDEQLDLIDVAPENAKDIARVGRLYKKAQSARIAAGNEEVKLKSQIKEFVEEAHLQRGEDGAIRFTCDSLEISIEPRDDVVKVKDKSDKKKGKSA